MEITKALLVAMMFIVLLTMSIGNILMALASTVDKRSPVRANAIHTGWVILLLLMHFNLFWHVLDILAVEEWKFLEFLYIVAGAILIFFATHVLLPDASSNTTDVRDHYFDVRRQFFGFLGLLMIWTIGVDLLFGDGFTSASGLNLVGLVLFIVMASSSQIWVHRIGTGVAWLWFAAMLAASGSGAVN